MARRTLTITMQSDWRRALRLAGRNADARTYQGETLNFETPEAFFGRLTQKSWTMVETLIGAGPLPIGELARRAGRDVKRVHEDVVVLAELGLVERTDQGGVLCPFTDIHVDMHLGKASRAA